MIIDSDTNLVIAIITSVGVIAGIIIPFLVEREKLKIARTELKKIEVQHQNELSLATDKYAKMKNKRNRERERKTEIESKLAAGIHSDEKDFLNKLVCSILDDIKVRMETVTETCKNCPQETMARLDTIRSDNSSNINILREELQHINISFIRHQNGIIDKIDELITIINKLYVGLIYHDTSIKDNPDFRLLEILGNDDENEDEDKGKK